MTTSFKQFLLKEAEDNKIDLSKISENLKKCIEQRVFFFRGQDDSTSKGDYVERESKRQSSSGYNFFLNLFPLVYPDIPDRGFSYFATSSFESASGFGDKINVIIPYDNVENFGIVRNDFNFLEPEEFEPFDTIIKMSDFISWSNAFGSSLERFKGASMAKPFNDFVKKVASQNERPELIVQSILDNLNDELFEAYSKFNSENESISQGDLSKFDVAFAHLMNYLQSSLSIIFNTESPTDIPKLVPELRRNNDVVIEDFGVFISTAILYAVWLVVKSKYHGKVSDLLITAMKNSDIDSVDFSEALQYKDIKDQGFMGPGYEIWFKGGYSYFSSNWCLDQFIKYKIASSIEKDNFFDHLAQLFEILLNKK
jgi:hypothetical protein